MSHVARTAVVAARASQNGVARAVPRAVATQPAAATTLVQRRWQSSGKVDRPLSPHLTIYRFGLNAITSVGHRGTGIFMAGGTCMRFARCVGQLCKHGLRALRAFGWSSSWLCRHRADGVVARLGVLH